MIGWRGIVMVVVIVAAGASIVRMGCRRASGPPMSDAYMGYPDHGGIPVRVGLPGNVMSGAIAARGQGEELRALAKGATGTEANAFMRAASAMDAYAAALDRYDTAIQGTPMPWSRNPPHVYTKASLRDQLREHVEARGIARLVDMSCEEFPCIAVLEMNAPTQVEADLVGQAVLQMAKKTYPAQKQAAAILVQFDPAVPSRRVGVAIFPSISGTQWRVDWRIADLLRRTHSTPSRPAL